MSINGSGSIHCAQISGGGPPGIWFSIFVLSHIKSIYVRRKIKSRMSFGARPSMSRSRSTPRLSRSGSGIGGYPSQRPETGGLGSASAGRKSRVDNTFQCDHGLGSTVYILRQ